MAVSSAKKEAVIIDLTDEDDVMQVNDKHNHNYHVTEVNVTSSAAVWLVVPSQILNWPQQRASSSRLDWVSHEEHETVKDMAIGKQHTASKYPDIC